MRRTSKLPSQLRFSILAPYLRLEHGGDIRKGKRKLARPFDPKRPLHLVMRSTRAKGPWSLLKSQKVVKSLVYGIARRYEVRIYQFANSGNHLHFLVRAKKKRNFQNFLRVLAGKIAQGITGAKKGHAIGKFWDSLTYSRLLSWGREFLNVRFYVIQNELESEGIIPFVRRRTRSHPR
jgi:REP element-mobilizing transposase RayT